LQYLNRRNYYREHAIVGLTGAEEEKTARMTEAFFDQEVQRGVQRLNHLCETLLQHLQQGSKIELFVKGFAGPHTYAEYSASVGKRRINSVFRHLSTFSNGALMPYLETGALVFTETSTGDLLTASVTNQTALLSHQATSAYHPDVARERRVEIVGILKW
jgi:hypothetical protein